MVDAPLHESTLKPPAIAVLRWLRALPPGAVVEWGSDNTDSDRPWATGSVDVLVPGLQEEARLHWAWTVLRPQDRPWDPFFVIPIVEDLHDIWTLDEPYPGAAALRGHPADRTAADLPDWLADRLGLGPEDSVASLAWTQRDGWSVSAITAALQGWTAVHAGRPDLSYRWTPDVYNTAMAAALVAATEPGTETYLVVETKTGRKAYATRTVMEKLLSVDPGTAANVIGTLREATS